MHPFLRKFTPDSHRIRSWAPMETPQLAFVVTSESRRGPVSARRSHAGKSGGNSYVLFEATLLAPLCPFRHLLDSSRRGTYHQRVGDFKPLAR